MPHWPHESIHPHHIEPQASLALSTLQRQYHVNSGNIHEQLRKDDSVVIFPVIQAGQFNIREEEECLMQLFDHLRPANSQDTTLDFRPLLNLTSGYFGLFDSYKNLILRSRVPTRIICASPEVRFHIPSNTTNDSTLLSIGEWFLRFQGNIQPSTRGLHVARAAIHGGCAHLSNSRSSGIRGVEGVEQARLDIPRKRCVRCFLPHVLKLTVSLVHLL